MKIDAETLKKQVILHLPYVLFLLVFAKLGEAVRLAPGADASQKLLGLSEGFALAFQSMWPGAAMDWLIGFCGAAIMRLAVYLRGKDAKKYRKNVEYGSARWGNKADIAPFMDPNPENNIILTQSEGLMLNGRPKNPANARNKNVLVVGGSGSGKTRFFIKPNLMQMHSSYVVTDPKGTVLVECGKMLQRGTPKLDKDGKPVRNEKGKIIYESYKIRVFNTINFQKSMHFNPFAYIHSEKDILKIVTTLIANTKGEGKAGDAISSSNSLMNSESSNYREYVQWVKGGFTTLAGRCIVAFAQQDGHNYGLVILGCDTLDHLFAACDDLFDWAFASFADRPLMDTKTVLTTIDLNKCRTEPAVELYAAAPVSGYGHSDDKVSYSFDLPESVSATVKEGQKLGTATVYLDGYEVGQVDLVTHQEYVSDFRTDIKATRLLLCALILILCALGFVTLRCGGGLTLNQRRRQMKRRR